MNFAFYVAKRYLFSKKSHNAINIISLVTVCGIAIATLATVCTLSIFNGFRGLVADTFSAFDPELKITAVKGKVFDPTADVFQKVRRLKRIAVISETLEDNVLAKYRERQIPVMMKGVSDNFDKLISVKDILFDGRFQLTDEIKPFLTVLSIGVASTLGLDNGFIAPVSFYAPKRNGATDYLSNPAAAFNMQYAWVSGIFMINQPVYDDNYMIVPISFARQLLDYQTEVSALEIKLKNTADVSSVKKELRQILKDDYWVKDRYEQQQTSFNMIHVEKWVTFLLLCFILLIAVFNLVGSLSMLIVDKRKDIDTLRFLGADNGLISRIFFFEGWLIAVFGGLVGIVGGILICLGQQHFGWLQLKSNNGTFIINAYPVRIEPMDLILIFIAVLVIGFLVVLYSVKYGIKKPA